MNLNTRSVFLVAIAVALLWVLLFLFFDGRKNSAPTTEPKKEAKEIIQTKEVVKTVVASPKKKSKQEICDFALSHKISKGSIKYDKPPRAIPDHWRSQFLLNGNVGLYDYYFDGSAPSNYETYTTYKFQALIDKAKNRQSNHYGDTTDQPLFKALDEYPIDGLDVVIFGTLVPFYEAVAIARGARSVTTIEYNKIVIEHPKVKTYTVDEFYSLKDKPQFDIGFSISSFEHDGLARYGDPLDPAGDLKAMLRARCILKPHGVLYLVLPSGRDEIAFNAHRIYGKHRLSLMFEGWMVLNTYSFGKKVLDGLIQGDHSLYVIMNEQFDKYNYYGQPNPTDLVE